MKKVMSKQSTKYFNHYYYHHGPAIYIQSTYYPPKSSLSAIEAYSTYIMLSQGENPYIPTTTSLLQNLSNDHQHISCSLHNKSTTNMPNLMHKIHNRKNKTSRCPDFP
jgi:hypothetical protein